MDSNEIAELFTQEADETIVSPDGKFYIKRFGALVVWDDNGDVWSEEFLTEAGAIDALDNQREALDIEDESC